MKQNGKEIHGHNEMGEGKFLKSSAQNEALLDLPLRQLQPCRGLGCEHEPHVFSDRRKDHDGGIEEKF